MRQAIVSLLTAVILAGCTSKEAPGSPAATASAQAQAAPVHQNTGATTPAHAHEDHDARHGGILAMEGDGHIELVVAADGAIDLYLSDAVRQPILPKDASGTITVALPGKDKQALTLTEDAAKGSLSAKGPPPADGADYTWKLSVRGAPMAMSMPVPSGGTAAMPKPPADHGGNDHAHGSPHGGVVQTLPDGHVEVKLDKTGDVTVWMLDNTEKSRSAKGVAASLRPVTAGSKEVALSYDEKSDTLRGKIGPVTQEHLDAVLAVTPAGGAATSVRFKFHLEAEGRHGAH
jgi:hypothetical protein